MTAATPMTVAQVSKPAVSPISKSASRATANDLRDWKSAILKTIGNFSWPEIPALPPPGQPVLVRVPTPSPRAEARRELRLALRQVLADWSGCSAEQIPLHETPRGPLWMGLLAGSSLDISLSYADGEAWMGLIRGGSIGIDVMRVQPVPELETLAPLYLGPAAWHTIQNSRHPDVSFALAWTELEARLKLLKQSLREFSSVPVSAAADGECASRHFLLPNNSVLALACKNHEKRACVLECPDASRRVGIAGCFQNNRRSKGNPRAESPPHKPRLNQRVSFISRFIGRAVGAYLLGHTTSGVARGWYGLGPWPIIRPRPVPHFRCKTLQRKCTKNVHWVRSFLAGLI
jgi:4'-phosphopantetheinyl transferase